MRKNSDAIHINYENIKKVSYAAILDRCIAHPLDNLITIHQKMNGRISTAGKQLLAGGRNHIYSGFLASLASAIPVRVGTYSSFFMANDYFQQKNISAFRGSIYASLVSAITESVAVFPSDLNRTRKVLGSKSHLSSAIVIKSYSMLLSRLIIENTIGLTGADILISSVPHAKDSPALTFSFALLAGMGSQILPAPFDWLKTRYMEGKQIDHKQELLNIKQGFFRTVALRSARAGICNAIVFSIVGETFTPKKNTSIM